MNSGGSFLKPDLRRFRTQAVELTLGLAALSGMGLFFCAPIWQAYLLWHSPAQPDAASGQLVAMESHGRVAYVRSLESVLFYILLFGGVCIAIASTALSRMIFGEREVQPFPGGWLWIPVIMLLLLFGLAAAVVTTGGRIPFGEWSL
jgi:hypothetical protein